MIRFATLLVAALKLAGPPDEPAPNYDLPQRIADVSRAESPTSNPGYPNDPGPTHLDSAPVPAPTDDGRTAGAPPALDNPASPEPMLHGETAVANQAAAPLKLPARPQPSESPGTSADQLSQRPFGGSATNSLITIGSSLAVCLGLFVLVAWFIRRNTPGGARVLPSEVVQILGHTPLPGRQQMLLVRCGRRLLLVNVSATGAETLTEINDPDEVSHLTAVASGADPGSNSASFRKTMEQFARVRPTPGFIDQPQTALSGRST